MRSLMGSSRGGEKGATRLNECEEKEVQEGKEGGAQNAAERQPDFLQGFYVRVRSR